MSTPSPVTIAQFRADFPAFTDTTVYPDAMIQWNITWATNLMNAYRWGNMYVQGMELLVAHLSFLNAQQNLAAAAGGAPGISKGMIASEGILTAKGGVSSHAALVAHHAESAQLTT